MSATSFSDCLDYNVNLTGASDMNVAGQQPIEYSFFDEITVQLDPLYSCERDSETVLWRLLR